MTAATVYVTFIGFEVIATSAEEIKNPGRNLPLSMIASVLTPTLLYVLVMFVPTGVLPLDEIAKSYIPVADVAEIVLEAGFSGSNWGKHNDGDRRDDGQYYQHQQ